MLRNSFETRPLKKISPKFRLHYQWMEVYLKNAEMGELAFIQILETCCRQFKSLQQVPLSASRIFEYVGGRSDMSSLKMSKFISSLLPNFVRDFPCASLGQANVHIGPELKYLSNYEPDNEPLDLRTIESIERFRIRIEPGYGLNCSLEIKGYRNAISIRLNHGIAWARPDIHLIMNTQEAMIELLGLSALEAAASGEVLGSKFVFQGETEIPCPKGFCF